MVTARALTLRALRLQREARERMYFVLLLLLFAGVTSAAENRYEGQPVVSVELIPQDASMTPQDIADKLSAVKVGVPLRMTDVRETIERLYASNRFVDVVADVEPAAGGVAVRFIGTGADFVRNVVVEGVSEPPSPGQLVNTANFDLGARFYPAQVRSASDRILDVLRSNGFYLAKVTPQQTQEPYQQIDLTFNVDSGDRARYTTPILRGDPHKSLEEIIRLTRWRRFWFFGRFRDVSDELTQQGIERIRHAYNKKDYLLARVLLEGMEFRQSDNRVIPTIQIDRGPKVSVQTRGFRISRGKLRNLVPIYQEQTVDKDLLVEGRRSITEYLQSNGYFEAEVEFDQEQQDSQQTILYSIFPGDRHKLVKVIVTGNKYFDDPTLRERMFTTEASFIRFRRGRFSQDYLRRDANAIRALYQQNGFRDVIVRTSTEDDYDGKENQVAAYFRVVEGPQWFVRNLTLEGADPKTLAELRPTLQSMEGQPYSELNVSTDVDTILTWFYNNGYPDARLDPTATPVAGANQMDLRYVIHPGERQFIRDVLISGLRTTRQDLVLSRIRNLDPGSPLAQATMIENQRRLYDLGIFARVDTALQNPDGDTDYKYVLYRFEEASRYSFNGGIGAQIARIGSTNINNFDAPAGAPGFSPRLSFGVSRNNFMGIGHTVSLQTQWAIRFRQRAVLTYFAPQVGGNDRLSLTFTGLYDDSRDVNTFTSRRREASAQLSQRVTKANTLQYRVGYRRVSISDLAITPALIPLFAQPVNLFSLSGTFVQDKRDDPVDARRGMYNTIDATLATNFFATPQTTFSRYLGRNASYHRLRRDLTLARQISFGVEIRHTNGEVPLPERFYGGGVSSHRGFPDYQAGPRDLQTGFPIGGEALLFHNTELRFPLIGENISGVLFHDMGNIYSSIGEMSFRVHQRDIQDFNYMVHAIGFGVRYRTPIGPIRGDIAWSINPPRFNGVKGTEEQLRNPDAYGPNCASLAIGCVQYVEQRISRFQFHFSLGQLF